MQDLLEWVEGRLRDLALQKDELVASVNAVMGATQELERLRERLGRAMAAVNEGQKRGADGGHG